MDSDKQHMRNKIIEELYLSENFIMTLSKIPVKYRDELKQHISLILLEMNVDRLIDVYNRKELNYYVYGIIQNQYYKGKKKTKKKSQSDFWKGYSVLGNGFILEDGMIVDPSGVELEDDELTNTEIMLCYLDDCLGEILDRFYYVNVNSINYFFNRQVFELYHNEGMSLMDISRNTNIKYETIRKSIRFTFGYIRGELKKNNI